MIIQGMVSIVKRRRNIRYSHRVLAAFFVMKRMFFVYKQDGCFVFYNNKKNFFEIRNHKK